MALRNKEGSLWFLTAAFIAVVVAFLASQFFDRKWTLLEFLDRQWMIAKQDAQRKWRKDFFKPTSSLVFMELNYPNRFEFWLDTTTKQKLRSFVEKYPGPIALNLDPVMVQKDPELASLYEKKNILKTFRLALTNSGANEEQTAAEQFLSKWMEQTDLAKTATVHCPRDRIQDCLGQPKIVIPSSPSYFDSDHLYGNSSLWETRQSLGLFGSQLDTASQFVFELSLRTRASRLMLPSQVLASSVLAMGCNSFQFGLDDELRLIDCRSQSRVLKLHDPLPLFFYGSPLKKMELDSPWPAEVDQSKLVFIEVTDSSSKIPTSLGSLMTAGEIVATGVSNILEGHSPISHKSYKWIAFLISALFMLLLFSLAGNSSSLRFLGVFAGGLILLFAIDFSLTFFANYRTESIEPFVALSFFGFVALGYVTRRDLGERMLVEQAFKGYVSEDRLKRLLNGEESLSLNGKKKDLSLLLLDIVNFSQLVKNISIENVFLFAQQFFGAIDPIIFKYQGTIDKKTGDGLLAFFGDHEKSSDPSQSARDALMTAVEIQARLEKLDFSELGIQSKVRVRIGINSGEMMIGNTGSSSHFNYTVLGEAVNFTQRLEAACPPGEILMGPHTEKLVRLRKNLNEFGAFLFEDFYILPKHESEAVKVCRVRKE